MMPEASGGQNLSVMSRRRVLKGLGVLAGGAALAPGLALAQAPPGGPPGPPTTYFTDPDIISVDPLFDGYAQPNSAITRLWTGAQWSEGPAWSSQGRYLVFSDVTGNTQYRYIWEDGRVTAFRKPSY